MLSFLYRTFLVVMVGGVCERGGGGKEADQEGKTPKKIGYG